MSPMDALTRSAASALAAMCSRYSAALSGQTSDFLLQTCQYLPSLVLELAIFRRPLRVERCVENLLQLEPCVSRPVVVDEQLGEKEVRGGAVVVVFQRLAQVLLRKLVVAPEETRHFEVPASQRAIRGSLLKRGVEAQHGEQRFLDG